MKSIDVLRMTTEFNDACNLAEKGEFHSAIAILEDFIQRIEKTDGEDFIQGIENTGEGEESNKEPRFLSRCFEALAQCYLEVDKPEKAFFAASKSVQLDPSWTSSHITFGRAARNTGNFCEAIIAFSEALALTSNEEADIKTELAEVEALRWNDIGIRVGVKQLKIKEAFGRDLGPGAVVWECGLLLSSYLSSQSPLDSPQEGDFGNSKRVLELGSGTGIAGIVCSLLGCQVTLTDQLQLLPIIQNNINLNRSLIQQHKGDCICQVLDWNTPSDGIVKKKWDVILGADLVYSVQQVDPLIQVLFTLNTHNPNYKFLFCHKTRSESLDQVLFQKLKTIDLNLTAIDTKTDSNIKIYSV